VLGIVEETTRQGGAYDLPHLVNRRFVLGSLFVRKPSEASSVAL
jgi:hypothetical protein